MDTEWKPTGKARFVMATTWRSSGIGIVFCMLASTCAWGSRSEEHTSELQSLMRTSYAVFCLKKHTTTHTHTNDRAHRRTHLDKSLARPFTDPTTTPHHTTQ